MNLDGTGRTKVAANARQPCWSPDGTAIAYLGAEFEKFTYTDYATKGLFFYDLGTGERRQHPNEELHHLYNICWSPDGNWFVATVHAGMGYAHAILAIEARGPKVVNLGIPGCRPDISPDGTQIAWGRTDHELRIASFNPASREDNVVDQKPVIACDRDKKVYHVDWSPDGRYLAFSYGSSRGGQAVGQRAAGWNICVYDITAAKWVQITTDGNHNKEPDWVAGR